MNLPNKITLVRVFLIPAFLFVYLAQPLYYVSVLANMWLALALFSIAAITDAIDGYLARRLKLVTNFGKLMDPLADKLLVCSALVAFVANGILPAWAVIILISREFYITGLRQLAVEQNIVMAASAGGKVKTTVQITLIVYILLPLRFFVFDSVIFALMIIAVVVSVWTAVDYTLKNIAIFSPASEDVSEDVKNKKD